MTLLKPADILCTRSPGLGAELIRIGEEMTGKPGLDNHVAVMHHYDSSGVPWGLEGRPGGVGWADMRPYLASPFTLNNCGQPGRGDEQRAAVAKQAEALLGTKYDWAAIGGDTLAALGIHLWNLTYPHGLAPGEVVCSAFAAYLYEQQGWARPEVTDRDTEPGDWTQFIFAGGYSVKP